MSESRQGFLRRVRTRMRLAWLTATAQQFAPYLGLAVALSLAVDWLTPFEYGLVMAGGLVAVCVLALLIGAAVLKITPWDASRAAERGLGARDAFTTALEFTDSANGAHVSIQDRADRLATGSRVSEAIPIGADGRRLRQLGLAAALALVIGLLPPLGSTPALSSDVASAIEAEADQVERIAAAVEESEVDTADEIVAELERLAQQLRRSETLEQALEMLEDSEKRLSSAVDPNFLSQKAAVQGLARDLALRPLSDGAPLDAASQLEQTAQDLQGLSDPELAALADRLGDLAESQASGNAELSSQLSEAARAISEGDLEAAARSLQNAAREQESGLDGARGQQALSETQRAIEGARSRLGGAGTSGEGERQGEGEGEGEGEGAGEGVGESPGGAGGQQSGGGSGEISNVAPGDGNASGQGGQGSVGANKTDDHGTDVETADVFDPIGGGSLTDLLRVDIDGGDADGDITGRADGPTTRGNSVVPYAQVLPQYLNQAADALGELQLPPSMRGIVQSYFDSLAEEAG
ncbi:MAG TPA: hypothetical protein VK969_02120 [Acidimicrobiia bacterium]|nr:hypothetical protein [Acidimicrobiia bacterium]